MPLSVMATASLTRPRAHGLRRMASSLTAPRSVNFTALSMRFSSAARSRTGSPTSMSGRSSAIATSTRRPLVSARAASESASASITRRGRKASSRSVKRAGIGAGGVDHQRRQGCKMFGAAFDAVGPAPFALAEIGACQQFAERQDAGQRGADVVGEGRQRDLVGAGDRRPAPRRTPRLSLSQISLWQILVWISNAP